MVEFGLIGILWFEEYGGIGSDYLVYVIVIEELFCVCVLIGVILFVYILFVGWLIFKFGMEE